MFLDEDDIFGGSPKSKFFDIIYNANRNLVEFELEKLLERQVALEKLLEQNYNQDEIENHIKNYIIDKPDTINEGKNDIFIGFVGDVLTNNE